jgi:hypothetical protein
MVELIWDDQFKKICRKWIRRHPELKGEEFANKISVFYSSIRFIPLSGPTH